MIILKDGDELSLINPVRMNDESISTLDKLGSVKRIVRLGDFHGLDDAFYIERYKCEFWAQDGQETYKSPQITNQISTSVESPFPDSEFFIFESAKYPEAALLIKKQKLLITTDSVQYHSDWSYFTWFTKSAFKLLGFKTGINIGPPWLKRVTAKGDSLKTDFKKLLELDFDSIVAAHGLPMRSGAKQALKQEVSRVFK
ncbi:hypothetical protein [Halopseudomonas salegens]|nr:hypothetical protein [Halopseudomonas salegens]